MAEKITLVLGGARSGKSTFAQQLAQTTGQNVLFLATAQVHDDEMARRVAAHRATRPATWETLEASNNLTSALETRPGQYSVILLDCVTLLLGGVFHNLNENSSETEFTREAERIMDDLFQAMENRAEHWILVSNEVGLGIVPDNLMGRVFRDVQGRANQQLAARADEVYFLAAGIPLKIK
jgi:adenosylcobinamide kinase / adenosylcobinamide-phosphate guanylyltransferase